MPDGTFLKFLGFILFIHLVKKRENIWKKETNLLKAIGRTFCQLDSKQTRQIWLLPGEQQIEASCWCEGQH